MLCSLAAIEMPGRTAVIMLSNSFAVLTSSSIMMIFMDYREFDDKPRLAGDDLDLLVEEMAVTQIDILDPHPQRSLFRLFRLPLIFYDELVPFGIKPDMQRPLQRNHIM